MEDRRIGKKWVYYDEAATTTFIDISDPSDDDSDDGDWRGDVGKKRGLKSSSVTRKKIRKSSGNASGSETVERPMRSGTGDVVGNVSEKNVGVVGASGVKAKARKKSAPGSSNKKGVVNLGKLDLNVECSNEADGPSRGVRDREGNATGNAEDNIEGIGFFEGLNEFLSSLPILNAMLDDKVKSH
ncbi:hypothetical protein KIW84_073695 [Lathyrus oleraceus]|uniref:Uncharacterized protein n=1 Tax=Pisum sativum TaxID=3888 RepID=A0A9D4ZYZ6_PEA|nr:hypothetical protein KIW84_073695 [Pisum sativum]